MRRAHWIALLFLLGDACDNKPPMVRSPDGHAWWYAIECGGSRAYCMDEAADVCPHGYDIMDADDTGESGSSSRVGRVTIHRSRRSQEIFVQCRHPTTVSDWNSD